MVITNADCSDLAEALHERGVTAMPTYAGMRNLDTSIQIDVADDDPAVLEEYRRVYRDAPNPLAIPISLRTVDYPLSRLREVMAQVEQSRAIVEPFDAYISVVGPNQRSNRVEISLSRYSREAADALYAEFGDMIVVNTVSRIVHPA